MSQLPVRAAAPANIDRRTFVRAALVPAAGAVAALPTADAAADRPTGATSSFPGLILREQQPLNLEFPFPTLAAPVTPNEQFFVRNHFAAPRLDVRDWKLRVEGAVEHPLELGYDELRKLPARSQVSTLECAGNGRGFLVPKAQGVPWELGAVGTAEWTGVPLAAILEKVGVKAGALEVILEGADAGKIEEEPKSPGSIHFARSLPLAKARRPEVLLAYRMNGADLPPAHGYPLRAVVAGWYGMASVKWLTRIVVSDRPFQGYFQSLNYTYFERRHGLPTLVPITEMQVKSEIARPARGEVIAAGTEYRMHGAAWAGEPEVDRVEVSTDGGKTWQAGRLLGQVVPFAWRLWEYTWKAPAEKGRYTLQVRATDGRGRVQPASHDPDRRAYLVNHVLPVEVEVR
jgi:DMSO/TMAO reductase YedYZ molybdopterin-dependent catalytic subunit